MASNLVNYPDSDASSDSERSSDSSVEMEEEVSATESLVRSLLDIVLTEVAQTAKSHNGFLAHPLKAQSYRQALPYSENSSSEDEDSDSDSSSEEEEKKPKNGEPAKAFKERKEDKPPPLPPIEDLEISVPAYECVHLGSIESVVEDTAVIRAAPEKPALDLDSV